MLNTRRDVTVRRDIQNSQATKPSEYDISNQCNLVEGQVPDQAASENSRRDVTVNCNKQKGQASKPIECATRNRCNLVAANPPVREICSKSL